MSIKFPVLGGGGYFGFWGGGECRFYFYGRADFSEDGLGSKQPNRYSNPVALHCHATLCCTTFSRIWRGVAGESRYTP